MTARTPRERVLRALDALLPYLHGFVNQALDASARRKDVAPDIGPLVHAINDEWHDVFAGRLNRSARNYIHELLDIRNRLSHSVPFNEDEARRACDTIRLVAQAIGAPLSEYDRRALHETDALPTGDAAPARVPRTPARQPSQRDVMRAIWARCARDEERTVREYAAAEHLGDAPRKQNTSGLTPEQYARALLADGLAKGWLRDAS